MSKRYENLFSLSLLYHMADERQRLLKVGHEACCELDPLKIYIKWEEKTVSEDY